MSLTSRLTLLALLACLFLAGCGRTYVDGYPVGDRMCGDGVDEGWLCRGLVGYARSSLDGSAPAHAPIVSLAVFRPDFRTPDGGQILHTRGTAGGEGVVVIRMGDDSVRAFYVSCIAGPWGPAPAPQPDDVHCDTMTPMDGES